MRAASEAPRSRAALLLAVALALLGCGDAGGNLPASSPPPDDLTGRFPDGAALLHSEQAEAPLGYRLWIYHAPGADALLDLSGMPGGPDGHELPGEVVLRLLEAKAPRFEAGRPVGGSCRFTHWTGEGVEYQARELVTDRGWIASVEELRPAG